MTLVGIHFRVEKSRASRMLATSISVLFSERLEARRFVASYNDLQSVPKMIENRGAVSSLARYGAETISLKKHAA